MTILRSRTADLARRSTPTVPRLVGRPRAFLRASHVIVSGAWLGLVIAMLVLGLDAATARDATLMVATYALMDRLGTAVIPVFAVSTILTGVALSTVTPWGLAQHYWVLVKLGLAIAVIVTGAQLTGTWVQQAGTQAASSPTGGATAWLVIAASAVHAVMLGVATVISVDKPWGKTPRGRRLAAARTSQRSRDREDRATSARPARR